MAAADEWRAPGYTHLRELGSGASGRVILAVRNATGGRVAIKYLSERLRADTRFLAGFRAEARLLARLTDPHLVRLYDYVETLRGAAIVMQLVDGVSLRAVLGSRGRLEAEAALVLLKGSLQGLGAAHTAGVVHRDYKPENVLVPADGPSQLVDFGIAVPAGTDVPYAGTPPYMAPEQWTGSALGPATDVYAATVVFFECLVGATPYRASTLPELARAHRSEPVPVAAVPEALRPLVERGMAKSPASRPQSAQAFAEQLEAAARAAYGPDWEARGRRALAAAAAALAALFPLALSDGGLAPGVGTPPGGAGVAPSPGGQFPGQVKGNFLGRAARKVWGSRAGVAVASAVTAAAVVLAGGAVVLSQKGDTTGQPPGGTRSTTGAAGTPTPGDTRGTTGPGGGSPTPGGSHSSPGKPPTDPGDVIVIIRHRTKGQAANYSYRDDACCNHAFDAFGTVTPKAPASTVDMPRLVNPYRVTGEEPWWHRVRCRATGDRLRVNAGDGRRTFRASKLTIDASGGDNTARAAWQALRARQAVGSEHVLALLAATGAGKLEVSRAGDTIKYSGVASVRALSKDERVSGLYGRIEDFAKTQISYSVSLGPDYLPLQVTSRIDSGKGPSKVSEYFRVGYWDWRTAGAGVPSP